MAPEIRTVFNSSKVLGDMVESWLVVAERRFATQKAHDELNWRSTPRDLVQCAGGTWSSPSKRKKQAMYS